MSRHTTTGRWRLGLLLALITMLAWATLPVALKLSLQFLDPWTLTWFRFVIAALVVIVWLGPHRSFGAFRNRRPPLWLLLLIAAGGLIGNYIFYLLGLNLTGPAIAQVVIQLAPVLMGLGGLVIFGERYSPKQWLGFGVLILGLSLFFHHQLQLFTDRAALLWQGAFFLVCAALTWVSYALAQKQLLRDMSSTHVMLFVYLFASFALAPTGEVALLARLNWAQWLILLYCAANTLVAYGAFAEALNHWEASRVSAVLALTPLGTFFVAAAVSSAYPQHLPPETLDWLSWAGAILVVTGSMVTSLAGRRRAPNSAVAAADSTLPAPHSSATSADKPAA